MISSQRSIPASSRALPYPAMLGYDLAGNAHGGNDILTVINSGDYSSARLYGDAGSNMYASAVGGNDTLTVYNSGGYFAYLYGDFYQMHDNAKGGNDTLTCTNSDDNSHSYNSGDAELMFDNTQGGKDTITVINSGYHTRADLIGDAGVLMRAMLTAGTTPSRSPIPAITQDWSSVFGDAANMYDNAVGGNDTITVTNSGKGSGCYAIGDAFDMHDNSKGGDDTITVIRRQWFLC